jgi:hypothetical protein
MNSIRAALCFRAMRLTTVLLWSLATLTFTTPAVALLSETVDITAEVTGGATDCNGGSNGFSYDYTVTNFATVFPMTGFQIPLSNVGDVCNIAAPLGWSSSFNGTTLIFQAISPIFYLQPEGAQLAGFEVDSPLPGVDELFTADLVSFHGIISVPVDPLAPVRVPEPAPWSLIAGGLMALALTHLSDARRRRTANRFAIDLLVMTSPFARSSRTDDRHARLPAQSGHAWPFAGR